MSTDVGHGIELTFDADMRFVHTFRQSTVGELDLCPERGRATMSGQMPRIERDATCLGTAVHAGIQAALIAASKGHVMSPLDMTNIALAEFAMYASDPDFRWEKYNAKRVEFMIMRCCDLFWDDLYEKLSPVLIEENFGPLTIYEDDKRVIQIKGTIDFLDAQHGLLDWKTTGDGRKYRRGFGGDAWKLDRWEPQPTFYCKAAVELGHYDPEGPWWFSYWPFDLSGAEPKLGPPVSVLRRPEDVSWMIERLLSYTELIERDVARWPKQDNHALCSPKWCDWWPFCKGAQYMTVPWPAKPPTGA